MYIRISFAYRTGSFVSENTAVSPLHIRLYSGFFQLVYQSHSFRELYTDTRTTTQNFTDAVRKRRWEKWQRTECGRRNNEEKGERRGKEMESKGRDLITRHRSSFSGCFHPSPLFSVSILLAFPFHAPSRSPSRPLLISASLCNRHNYKYRPRCPFRSIFGITGRLRSYLGTRISDKFLDVGLFQTRRPHENIPSS